MPLTTNSDSEDDLDYVPPEDGHDSDNSDDHDEVANAAQHEPPKSDPTEQKKQRDALWASFQASVSTPPPNGAGPGPSVPTVNRVKIEKAYLFAGKRVTEVVEVAEDSEEAKKWPRWTSHTPTAEAAPASTLTSLSGDGDRRKRNDKDDRPVSPAPALGSAVAVEPVTATPLPTVTTTPTPGPKRPGPRKPHTVLPSLPKASQAKKITTLDKSAMDWRAHVTSQSSDVKDELDANRRGGGYLEKVDFLKRVEDRREDVFEANKASKRRKT